MAGVYIKNVIIDDNVKFRSVLDSDAFSIHGLLREDGKFVRFPEAVAKTVSPAVHNVYDVTTGGRVRFVTDSKTIAIKVVLQNINLDSNTTVTGNAGFDVYERRNGKQYFVANFMPPFDVLEKGEYTDVIKAPCEGARELVLNFPMWCGVVDLFIGLEDGAMLEKPTDYTVSTPVVFYGSSITMGKCMTRPGCIYESLLSQQLDFDFVNLGFGGAAKGEQTMADYIAGLKMSAFVLDYDHNAPNADYLKQTQWSFYKTVREKNPTTPILMMTRPKYYLTSDEVKRKEAVMENYERALAEGDKNVYFIPGDTLMDERVRDNGTIDGIHPTDAGFVSMAYVIQPVLKDMLKI